MTHNESVQPLQSIKLVYQPCSRSRAALDPYGIDDHQWLMMMNTDDTDDEDAH